MSKRRLGIPDSLSSVFFLLNPFKGLGFRVQGLEFSFLNYTKGKNEEENGAKILIMYTSTLPILQKKFQILLKTLNPKPPPIFLPLG
jgi:hypothetical protein